MMVRPMAKKKKKKVAVLVRDRVHEALRMAVGLTLADDEVSVFIMDRPLPEDGDVAMHVEGLREMRATLLSNHPANSCEQMSTEEIARALADFDVVIPY
jgi:hypothetical protein